ncbi:hypothetical protein [Aurantiacibacter gilvus]|uniref:DUF2846 domain-containing protein n=1 Tax=Aurantiacibacter gilvus TaxID=3139141 RepID=A0ABU9IA53_9SPHN
MVIRVNSPRIATLLALSLSISACWSSSAPLFEASQSVTPLPSGEYLYHSGAGESQSDRVALWKIPGGGYVYYNKAEDNALPLLTYEFDDGWYLLQIGPTEETLLLIARTTPTRIEVFDPDCDEEIGAISGVGRTESRYSGYNCSFNTLEAAVAAAQFVQARIESGVPIEPHGWFEPTPIERFGDANP